MGIATLLTISLNIYRTLLYLQLIIQIQSKLADTTSSSNILKKPEHILLFIKHSLESGSSTETPKKSDEVRAKRHGLGLDDLRIVPEQEDTLDSEDSDDEIPDDEDAAPDEEMTVTTINLLLAILEGVYDFVIEFCSPSKGHLSTSEHRPVRSQRTRA